MNDAAVIIVGAGPAGTSTAWHLAQMGIEVLVLDRAAFPRDKPCAEYLSPEASRLLSAMGALEACEAAGAERLEGMIVRAPDGAELRGDFAATHGYRAFSDWGLALRRTRLDPILLSRASAAGARVEQRARVTDLLRDARGVVRGVRTLEHDGRVRDRGSRVVVGADGLRSVVARRLGLARRARGPRRIALVAHYEGVAGMGPHGEMHVERDGYVGLARVDGGLVNVAMVLPAELVRAAGVTHEALFDRWLGARTHLVRRLRGARRVSPVRATGPFASHARHATAGGTALVGDAADFFDPFTGEGIYAALRGGEMLAPAVARALAAPSERAAGAELAAYDRERHRAFAGKWRVERLAALATACPPLMNRVARGLARRKALADLFVGVTGDFVPAREVLSLRYLARVLLAP